jgi:hypothetical protein
VGEEKHIPRVWSESIHPGGLNAGMVHKVRRIQNKTELQGKGMRLKHQLCCQLLRRERSGWRLQLRAMRLKV